MQEFKLDRVKIDRRFVENMDEADAAKMVQALAGLGHGLGLAVSAEGIQGGDNNSSLLRSGVDEAQSSANSSRPRRPDAFSIRCRARRPACQKMDRASTHPRARPVWISSRVR